MFGRRTKPEGRGNTCGHIRCQAGACQVARPPALEALPPGPERAGVREAFRGIAINLMDSDREWSLDMARIARLDATR